MLMKMIVDGTVQRTAEHQVTTAHSSSEFLAVTRPRTYDPFDRVAVILGFK